MEVDVREQRRNYRSCWRSNLRLSELTAFHNTRGEPLADQPQKTLIPDAVGEKTSQPPLVNRVEEFAEIRIDHPIDLTLLDADRDRIKRIVLTAPGPKPIGETDKVALLDGN